MVKRKIKLDTEAKNTWCPGCGNFGIFATLKQSLISLIEAGTKKENLVLVSGIGCSSKTSDYLNLNSFISLHGRPVATAEGIKIGNPDLKVIVVTGDGGTYNEGISHLIHAAKRNIDITVLIHDNRTFALTTGQFTATSPEGFNGGSSPGGSIEKPFNPIELMLASGATFIARGYAFRPEQLQDLIKKAIEHKGFSFIDILQPCVTFFDTMKFYNERCYQMEKIPASKEEVMAKIKEWDYQGGDKNKKIPLGIFYKEERNTYEKKLLGKLNPSKSNRTINLEKLLM